MIDSVVDYSLYPPKKRPITVVKEEITIVKEEFDDRDFGCNENLQPEDLSMKPKKQIQDSQKIIPSALKLISMRNERKFTPYQHQSNVLSSNRVVDTGKKFFPTQIPYLPKEKKEMTYLPKAKNEITYPEKKIISPIEISYLRQENKKSPEQCSYRTPIIFSPRKDLSEKTPLLYVEQNFNSNNRKFSPENIIMKTDGLRLISEVASLVQNQKNFSISPESYKKIEAPYGSRDLHTTPIRSVVKENHLLYHPYFSTINPYDQKPLYRVTAQAPQLRSPDTTVRPRAGSASPGSYHTETSSSEGSPDHPNQVKLICHQCKKSYSTIAGLNKHQEFSCPKDPNRVFSCKFCNKQYTSHGALKMHIRTHTLPCKCHICGKAFSRPWLLQGHIRTHTGEKPFECPQCHRSFADRSNLRAHLQTHAHVKKYACETCPKTFSRMSLLSKHTNSGCPGLPKAKFYVPQY